MVASEYHVPVMLKECIEGLDIKPDGVYVDVTFGGGGHTREMLKYLERGKLFAFDQDPDAKRNTEGLGEQFTLIEANFRFLKKYLRLHGIKKVDGILADLGISSHQIDEGARGFSIRFDGELDMRMDQEAEKSAKVVVNEYSEEELVQVFRLYGELRNARQIAQEIVKVRASKAIETTTELVDVIRKFAKRNAENKFLALVFQALRIEVNDELEVLKDLLEQSSEVLNENGRLVVMSYHSLEDRLVKNYLKSGKFEGEVEKDFYGNLIRPFKPLKSKPLVASMDEIALNNRARSAKLRIGIKLSTQ
ncbi:16S rRNA (cytosine(1402)-N(4))-methyltransferase RsmH [Rapidithrix thailandica]|uniref:Ribosomal RNA small subunit methyltransferase H n=1 Tax=Rapidithrix thailandica TaxID=413964 RepID=A0AAW9S8X7_9BACT